jgi:adenine-specific DNA-methyltransferase
MESYNHYTDRQTHGHWLEQIEDVCRRIHPLLTPDGSLWVSIDDREMHYLKVALDGIFGRHNFINTIVWEQRTTRENRKVFSNNHEYILVYAKDCVSFKKTRGLLEWDEAVLTRYKNPDRDLRGPWQSVSANAQAGHATASQFYELVAPNGRRHLPPKGRCWVYSENRMREEIEKGNIWFGRDGSGVPRIKKFLHQVKRGFTPHTLWKAEEVGTNDAAKKHLLNLFPDEQVFDTPKPESLIHRVLTIASSPGDLVLDAYLGSGTTAAVAHKMGRRYVGIECGDHAITHCADRIRKVIAGENGGISSAVKWEGGGPDFELIEINRSNNNNLQLPQRSRGKIRRAHE